jgi:heterodisulfide reductase subunit A
LPDAYALERGPYCDDCRKCVEACPPRAIDLDEQPRLITVNVGAIILALGFQNFDLSQQEELGYGRYPNVLEALEYERLASRSGPTEGHVLRPSDGKTPHSIAWLQCIGSRDQKNAYCSSICCMYATKEAMLAKQRLGGQVECSIFIMDERAFNKEYSAYFTKARQQYHIQFNRCRVSAIYEDAQTHDLLLQYTDRSGKTCQQPFEMVVLATGLQPPESAGHLAQVLDIELNEYGFCQTDKFTPLQTTRPGVYVCGAFSSPKEIAETIIDASGAAAEAMRLLNDRLHTYPYTRVWPFLSKGELGPERPLDGEAERVGVFVCSCGGSLGKNLDLPNLAKQASRWPGVVRAEVVDYACFPECLATLQKRIPDDSLNRVVIAACSNRTHEALFQRSAREAGLNPYLVEVVNLRDQCSRVHLQQPGLANKKAVELVRVAVGRAIASRPVYKEGYPCLPSALVIGGGAAGMTAALAVADSGYDVHLVEKTEMLGGNLQNLYYVAEGYNPQRLLRDLVNRVRAHQRITVYTRTEMSRQSGHVGKFNTELVTRHSDGTEERTSVEHGVIIVATGGRETREHPWLSIPGVTTQSELEENIIHRPEEIARFKDVVMIQCVHPDGMPDYCSRVCCTNTMKNAIRLKLFNPSCQVNVLYKNIVTYGFREQYYTDARRHGVTFIRYTDERPPQIERDGNRLVVRVPDLSLGVELELPADMVTLSMAVSPAEETAELAKILRIPLSSEGFFEEAQMKLRPMDFMRDGIFLAGMAHYPKFIEESISQALAAAGRAITLLSQEVLYLGGVVAQVDPEKCVGCLTCTRTCPFSIPQVVQLEGRTGVGGLGGAAYIDPALCQGCGTCTGECPAAAIQLVHYTDDQMMLHSIGGLGSWRLN